jgi:peptidyl-prolyl cis-trans isomerase A (cyclophilin A)
MRIIATALLIFFSTLTFAEDTAIPAVEVAKPYVTIQTTQGDIILELYPQKAPITVANFLAYIKDGYYNGTIFHRVMKDFMIQGGGFTESMNRKNTLEEIKNEADNGLFNNRGAITMARTSKVDSATSQFFINIKNNYFLNNGHRDFGYAVFGNVISGMNVVDTIGITETGRVKGMSDVPLKPIIITNVTVSYNKP